MKQIYLDHAATTYTDPRVLEAMMPYFTEIYGNAESNHKQGKQSLVAIDNARETIAKILNCRATEIIFCGTATEANNLAIFGTIKANKKKGKHLITSRIEHSSVRVPFTKLEEEGYEVTWLEVDQNGLVNPQDLEKVIRPDTILASIMYANNEIGTIEPISKLGEICKKNGTIFHTDACQAAGACDLNVENIHVDLLTLNGSKIYGPKGIGILYIKKGTTLEPIILGGSHENGLRAGTHNTSNIVGMAKALELVQMEKDLENPHLTKLRDKLITGLFTKISNTHINGHPTQRLPNNASITFDNINSSELMLLLDENGIYVSTGSACNVGAKHPSETLSAIGLSPAKIDGTIRFSLGKTTTEEDINHVLEILPKIVVRLRGNN